MCVLRVWKNSSEEKEKGQQQLQMMKRKFTLTGLPLWVQICAHLNY